jgi:branched-chain amino acid transport system ATP-binding protein
MNNQEYRGTALRLERVSKRFGGVVAVEDVSLAIHAGERHVLIGPNGAGKTTLFNCVTGTLSPSAGQIRFFGDDVTWLPERDHAALGMGRTFQISNVFTELTVAENLMLAVVGRDRRKWTMHKQFGALQEVADKVRGALAKVRLDHRLEDPVATLSYGERKQLDLALALAVEPRALFLDEPCAGLAPSERNRVSQIIGELPGDITVVMIEHDMDIALRLAERVTVLHHGRVIFEGAPGEVESDADVREVYFGTG